MIIAIDGPAAAGKGTLARRLAARLGLRYLDTGRLYRAAGLLLARMGGDPANEQDVVAAARLIDADILDDPEIRSEASGNMASRISALPALRAALLDMQKRFAHTPPGAVLDGRDIGTVVCPDADIKLFVTASAEKRAERRVKELRERGETAIWERILEDLQRRDAQDSAREAAPLAAAPDAILLDTSDLNADQAFEKALDVIRSKGLPI